ncbi:MAG: hypothetical protein WB760_09075 [Xanthobacteraceae bacterium]
MNDRPIDKIRNSALTMTLPADTGGITHMGEINGALHVIGGSAIYRMQLADEIDPERTNIAIPNTHQKVLSYGTDFPYVRQTLMTARRLFSNKVLGPAFDYKTGINLSFEALQDLAAMHDIRKDVRARFDKIAEDLKNLAVERRSMTVPSMGDVRGGTKAFLQKADHIAVALFNIAKLFYGDEIGPRWFASLHKLASEKYGDNDGFTKVLNAALPFLQFVRNARNAVEHPDQTKSVKVTDIALLPSGELNPPSIEVIHPETPQPSVPLLTLMEHVADQLATAFEVMLAHLCGANLHPFAGMPLGVIEYDKNQQKAFKCRYGYASRMGNQIVPFG